MVGEDSGARVQRALDDGDCTNKVSKTNYNALGNKSLLFRDPDGNLVSFFTPVSAESIKKFDGK